MTRKEAKSCIGTIEMLQRLAYNIHGVMDVIDADNCEKIIKALEQESNKSEIPTGSTTKNDPEVDCISRQAVLEIYDEWFATCNIADKKESPKAKINALPKVTPIRPKGHWIEERNDYGEIEHWHCSNCYDDSGFITTCKWDYCPNCGADMRGEEE